MPAKPEITMLNSDQQKIFEDVLFALARDLPEVADFSDECRAEIVAIFHETILKGLHEVGYEQWKQRRGYALHRIAKWASYIKQMNKPGSEITPADLQQTLHELSDNTQKAMIRLDTTAFPPNTTPDDLKAHATIFFPFCPLP